MKSLQLDLVESNARLIIEGLRELEAKWDTICKNSDNEDEVAYYGNDLIELRLLIQSTEEQAINVFGNNVINFSREAL